MSAKKISADLVWRTSLNKPFGAEGEHAHQRLLPSGQIRRSVIVVLTAGQRAQRYMFQRLVPGNIIRAEDQGLA
jgi:hypothetical protein